MARAKHRKQLYQVTIGKVESHRAIASVFADDPAQAENMVEAGMKGGTIRPAWHLDRTATPKDQVLRVRVDPVDTDHDLYDTMTMLAESGMALTVDAVRKMDDLVIDHLLAMERENGFRIPVSDLDREALDFTFAQQQGLGGTSGFTDLALLVELFDQRPEWRDDHLQRSDWIRIDRPWCRADEMTAARQGWAISNGHVKPVSVTRPSRAFDGAITPKGVFDRLMHLALDRNSSFHRRALLAVGRELGLNQDSHASNILPRPGHLVLAMNAVMHQAGCTGTVEWLPCSASTGGEFQFVGNEIWTSGRAQQETGRFAEAMSAIGAPVDLALPGEPNLHRREIVFRNPVDIDLSPEPAPRMPAQSPSI